ncbi:MAG: hypothetical protein LBI63_05660, partial [Candidatus Ancillula sp.]|nr:hypothetical protein [Candidatus Ancillula sp.]
MGNNLGGYNNLRLICENSIEASIASKVFHDALHNIAGVSYKPLLFATQVVNGINYKFIALGTMIVPNLPNDLYKI